MKLIATFLLLGLAAPSPELRYFRYERSIETPPQSSGQTCAVLSPEIFSHAAPRLSDLRLYRGSSETPYVIQMSAPVVPSQEQIAPLNLGRRAGQTVFDLAMPAGRYRDVDLAITGHDFIATVTVSGTQEQASAQTRIGSYTIFDLTRQRLGRSTVLHLPDSDFRFLHFSLAGPIAPENVSGLLVERIPVSEAKYQTVAETSQVAMKGRDTVIEFTVPSHTPVDRVVFVPGAVPTSFSRDARVSVLPIVQKQSDDAAGPPRQLAAYGSFLRVHRLQDGHRLDEDRLNILAPEAEFDTPAKWTVTIENRDDAPIQVSSMRLEMLERSLCFDASDAAGYNLYYGDSALTAPRYDYASLFAQQSNAAKASTGPERTNPDYQDRPDSRPFTERHPVLLWVALAFAVLILGAVALRSAKLTTEASS
jgi:Protein of unknown function (DUF3999)